jgi:hypothetical protein
VLFVVLIYISLDLSLPSMPGAFVFDPGESVESVHGGRGRPAIDTVSDLPGTSDHDTAVTQEVGNTRDLVPKDTVVHDPSHPRVGPRGNRTRAIANLTSRSEDPH